MHETGPVIYGAMWLHSFQSGPVQPAMQQIVIFVDPVYLLGRDM
jgi:hypothetical protein